MQTAEPAVRDVAAPERAQWRQWVPLLVTAGALVLAPTVMYPVFLMKALCLGLFACAFNLLIGYVGLLSFGHAMFFGAACYATAYASKVLGWPPGLSIVFGAAVALALGLVVGLIAIRRQGIYFAMITLALAQMFYFFCIRSPLTGGEDGIQGVPRGRLFGVLDLSRPLALYFVVLAIFLGGFFLVYRIIHSPFGQVLKAIRENEPRAISLGYKPNHYKLIAFVLSATLSGVAGSAKALVFRLASLSEVHWSTSGAVVLMVLMGGMGTTLGPLVGGIIITILESYLSQLGAWVMVAEGAIFMVCVLTFRRGVIGELSRLIRRPL